MAIYRMYSRPADECVPFSDTLHNLILHASCVTPYGTLLEERSCFKHNNYVLLDAERGRLSCWESTDYGVIFQLQEVFSMRLQFAHSFSVHVECSRTL